MFDRSAAQNVVDADDRDTVPFFSGRASECWCRTWKSTCNSVEYR